MYAGTYLPPYLYKFVSGLIRLDPEFRTEPIDGKNCEEEVFSYKKQFVHKSLALILRRIRLDVIHILVR